MDKGVRGIVFAAAFFASGGGKIRSFRRSGGFLMLK